MRRITDKGTCNNGLTTALVLVEMIIILRSFFISVTLWRSWLSPCAISGKIGGSIPDGVIGFFFIDIIVLAAL